MIIATCKDGLIPIRGSETFLSLELDENAQCTDAKLLPSLNFCIYGNTEQL